MVKASASRAEDPGLSHTSDLKIGTPVATLPNVIGPVLRLVNPVSVYCDWVRWKFGSATSIAIVLADLSRSVPEIHSHVAGTLSNQQTNNPIIAVVSERGTFVFESLDMVLACTETATREAIECSRYFPATVRLMSGPVKH